KDSTEILGGYNPIEWKSDDSNGITKDSFIFSFKNSDDIESYILSRVKNERFAIYNYYDNGPNFSNSLTLMDNFGFCENDYYENQIRETYDNFFMEEYEVFQAIREISS
ncbi:hypothetical protein RhiirA1_462484, partial [Rhizophagus irregularis]